jgi:hypothetical protein
VTSREPATDAAALSHTHFEGQSGPWPGHLAAM